MASMEQKASDQCLLERSGVPSCLVPIQKFRLDPSYDSGLKRGITPNSIGNEYFGLRIRDQSILAEWELRRFQGVSHHESLASDSN